MTTMRTPSEKAIDNVQDQIDKVRREGDAFRPHVNKQVDRIDHIYEEMATRKGLDELDAKFDAKFDKVNLKLDRIDARLDDHGSTIAKIAKKLGVSI